MTNWIQKPDGTFKAFGVPGPLDFDAWFACAKVYRAILFMLRDSIQTSEALGRSLTVVTSAALDAYLEAFRTRIGESAVQFAQQKTEPAEKLHRVSKESFRTARYAIHECHGMRSSLKWHTMQTNFETKRRPVLQFVTRVSSPSLLAPMVLGTDHAHGVVSMHGVNKVGRNWALLEVSPVAALLEIVSRGIHRLPFIFSVEHPFRTGCLPTVYLLR